MTEADNGNAFRAFGAQYRGDQARKSEVRSGATECAKTRSSSDAAEVRLTAYRYRERRSGRIELVTA